MAANVETMFFVGRQKPWHGLGTSIENAPDSREAFSFTDKLLGEGVRYETAGSLLGGKKTWILAKMPSKYIINGVYRDIWRMQKIKIAYEKILEHAKAGILNEACGLLGGYEENGNQIVTDVYLLRNVEPFRFPKN